ncbi:hypothetical protein [Algibacter sp. R77976]|uniref:hypothetical protein n=1 Tax=Algibacter sp. R77976 TaxID=3093873 RepID=UPI0037CA7E82
MIEKVLLNDGKKFATTKQIKAKRPSEYWLLFIKRYVLSYKESWFRLYYLLFLIPIAVVILMFIFNVEADTIFPLAFISFILSIIVFTILKVNEKKALVPINAFQELAKFIISIKGDVHRNLIGLNLNAGVIEADTNALDPLKIGLQPIKGVKYKPFEMQRFRANFTLNDGSICLVSLHQIALRVITTKRRSSGKTKTKMKRKHKFFYQLALKLKTSDYNITPPNLVELSDINTAFDVTVKDNGEFCWVKVKSKKKLLNVSSQLDTATKHKESIFTSMMQHLITQKVIEYRGTTKLLKS